MPFETFKVGASALYYCCITFPEFEHDTSNSFVLTINIFFQNYFTACYLSLFSRPIQWIFFIHLCGRKETSGDPLSDLTIIDISIVDLHVTPLDSVCKPNQQTAQLTCCAHVQNGDMALRSAPPVTTMSPMEDYLSFIQPVYSFMESGKIWNMYITVYFQFLAFPYYVILSIACIRIRISWWCQSATCNIA